MEKEITNIEQQLLLLTSRLTLSIKVKQEIINIFKVNNINWFEFFKLAAYHKTLSIALKNIRTLCPDVRIPKYLKDLNKYLMYCTKIRNECYINEIKIILNECNNNGITIIPVKGACFLGSLYDDISIRYSGDMDFLIKFSDISEFEKIINNMGYIQGKLDSKSNKIMEIDRKTKIKWKMYMSNLYPFIKMSKHDLFSFYKLDIRYALDDSLNKEPVIEMLQYAENNKISFEHYLIHLCTHFYDEAKHTISIANFKDLNLIKLLDIREFAIKEITDDKILKFVKFAKKYNLENAVGYTMFFLKNIYNDGYESKILDLIDISDAKLLDYFGESTIKQEYKFKKNIWERFFSCGNNDELISVQSLTLKENADMED